jgi:predicted 3-demethylubiquinone-9 3-methyltransferase (glyoxalase superfamily)
MSRITPCLWFDAEGEEAAIFYTSVFPNSRITEVTHYGEAGPREAGLVMTVAFELDGMPFVALNGGPQLHFTDALSLQVDCHTQEEIDHYWSRLGEGGEEGPCGWLKDRFGLSWQVEPVRLRELLTAADADAAQRVMAAFQQMRKVDIATLEAAAAADAQLPAR